MKTNKDYILREIAGSSILIPTGAETARLNGMIELTETGAFIWKHADEAESIQKLTQMLLEEYEVEEKIAARDVTAFAAELMMRGMLSEVPDLEVHTPDGKPLSFDMQMKCDFEKE